VARAEGWELAHGLYSSAKINGAPTTATSSRKARLRQPMELRTDDGQVQEMLTGLFQPRPHRQGAPARSPSWASRAGQFFLSMAAFPCPAFTKLRRRNSSAPRPIARAAPPPDFRAAADSVRRSTPAPTNKRSPRPCAARPFELRRDIALRLDQHILESDPPEKNQHGLRRFGDRRDQRSDCVQVIIALS